MSNLVKNFELKKGDFVVITGNFNRYLLSQKRINKNFDANELIDEVKNVITDSGTLMFHAFSWDFCHGIDFDIRSSKSKTGALSNLALQRADFVRSAHPIYSFAVYGKFAKTIANLSNISSFGEDSPFAIMHKNNAKMIIVSLALNHSFTFVHYVEQICGINYRFNKNFAGYYIDQNGIKSKREYSMFVRKDGVVTQLDNLEKIFLEKGVMKINQVKSDEIKIINLSLAFDVIKDDITQNKAKNLHIYQS